MFAVLLLAWQKLLLKLLLTIVFLFCHSLLLFILLLVLLFLSYKIIIIIIFFYFNNNNKTTYLLIINIIIPCEMHAPNLRVVVMRRNSLLPEETSTPYREGTSRKAPKAKIITLDTGRTTKLYTFRFAEKKMPRRNNLIEVQTLRRLLSCSCLEALAVYSHRLLQRIKHLGAHICQMPEKTKAIEFAKAGAIESAVGAKFRMKYGTGKQVNKLICGGCRTI